MHREVKLVFQLLRLNFEPDLECEKKTEKKQEKGQIILMLHSLLVIRI